MLTLESGGVYCVEAIEEFLVCVAESVVYAVLGDLLVSWVR